MPTRRQFLEQTAVASVAAAVPVGAFRPLQSTGARRRPGVVETVRGPIDADRLGFTLPHEHLCVASAGFLQTWPEYFGGRASLVARVTAKLKTARDEGVNSVVDVTPADVGRDIRFIEEVSRRSGMQVIACTGHWLYPSLSMSARTVEELTDFFVREITRGIEGTEIKAGVIKVAADRDGINPFLEKALRAAARASKATGTPVTTHSYSPGRIGEKQAEILEAEGLNPAMACIGHSDDTDDIDYLLGLVRRGSTIGMDHLIYGIQAAEQPEGDAATAKTAGPRSWKKRAESIKKLVDAGYANRMFLSNDWFFGIAISATGAMETFEKTNPDGILFATRKVIPYLEQIGVSGQAIRTMTVENPKRFFCAAG